MSLKDFQILSKLGEGAYSNVYKVQRISDGQIYALKRVKLGNLSDKEKENALNEVRILASIQSTYIVSYKEAFFDDNSLALYIVMEYAGGGDLLAKLNTHYKSKTYMEEKDIWVFAIQMIIGLKALHDMKILHRDLKSANVFLLEEAAGIKLGDLNVSKVLKNNMAYTQTGTPYYASPEIWRDQPYNTKSDIWSLGCVIYEMCALKPPFRGKDMESLYQKVKRGIFDPIPSHYSIDLYHLISMCLQISATSRPSCEQLLVNPIIVKKGGEMLKNLPNSPISHDLLSTIRVPRNMKWLSKQLPKARYGRRDIYSLNVSVDIQKSTENNDSDSRAGNDKSNGLGKRAISQNISFSVDRSSHAKNSHSKDKHFNNPPLSTPEESDREPVPANIVDKTPEKEPKAARKFIKPKDPKSSKDLEKLKETIEPSELSCSKEPTRESKDSRTPRDTRETKDSKTPRDTKESRTPREILNDLKAPKEYHSRSRDHSKNNSIDHSRDYQSKDNSREYREVRDQDKLPDLKHGPKMSRNKLLNISHILKVYDGRFKPVVGESGYLVAQLENRINNNYRNKISNRKLLNSKRSNNDISLRSVNSSYVEEMSTREKVYDSDVAVKEKLLKEGISEITNKHREYPPVNRSSKLLNSRNLVKVPSENIGVLSKRADQLLKKYHIADGAASQKDLYVSELYPKKNESRSELNKVQHTGSASEAEDIINKYKKLTTLKSRLSRHSSIGKSRDLTPHKLNDLSYRQKHQSVDMSI